ncbi:hypothetical protein HK098_004996 [Nowakowskiella sp. JEL0407]|nr:hypothetical protein HK098_004996 [Nowakowskiella sp. JEL0407]
MSSCDSHSANDSLPTSPPSHLTVNSAPSSPADPEKELEIVKIFTDQFFLGLFANSKLIPSPGAFVKLYRNHDSSTLHTPMYVTDLYNAQIKDAIKYASLHFDEEIALGDAAGSETTTCKDLHPKLLKFSQKHDDENLLKQVKAIMIRPPTTDIVLPDAPNHTVIVETDDSEHLNKRKAGEDSLDSS